MLDAETTRALTAVDRDLIEARVRAMYEVRVHSTGEAVGMEYFTHDVVFEVVGNPRVHSFCGRRIGADAMREALKAIRVELEISRHILHEIIIDGDRVAVRRTIHLRGRGAGRVHEVETLDRILIRDGLIAEMEQFVDTEALMLATNRAA